VQTPLSRIVVVEHGQEDAFVLCHLLEKAGLQVTPQIFPSGEAAVEFLVHAMTSGDPRSLPSALFVNVWLRGLTGFDLLKWVRKQEPLRSTPMIMLSRFDEPRDLGKATRLGADGYLIKFPSPSAMRELLGVLDKRASTPWPRPAIPVVSNLLTAPAPV
jgi:CheY-like chemotaxis protein